MTRYLFHVQPVRRTNEAEEEAGRDPPRSLQAGRCSRGILKNEQENLLDIEQPLPFMFLTEVPRPSTGPNNTEPGQVLCVCFFLLVAKVINTNYRKCGV